MLVMRHRQGAIGSELDPQTDFPGDSVSNVYNVWRPTTFREANMYACMQVSLAKILVVLGTVVLTPQPRLNRSCGNTTLDCQAHVS
jgi:hypothetical protein